MWAACPVSVGGMSSECAALRYSVCDPSSLLPTVYLLPPFLYAVMFTVTYTNGLIPVSCHVTTRLYRFSEEPLCLCCNYMYTVL